MSMTAIVHHIGSADAKRTSLNTQVLKRRRPSFGAAFGPSGQQQEPEPRLPSRTGAAVFGDG